MTTELPIVNKIHQSMSNSAIQSNFTCYYYSSLFTIISSSIEKKMKHGLCVAILLTCVHVCVYSKDGGSGVNGSYLVIDWDSDIAHLPEHFGLKPVVKDVIYQWIRYIPKFLQSRLLAPYSGFSLKDMYVSLIQPHRCLVPTVYTNKIGREVLFFPCQLLVFETWTTWY